MRHRLVAVGLTAMLVMAFAPNVAATTTRTPFHILSQAMVGFDEGTTRFVGNTMHVDDMVLVFAQDADVDLLDGVFTVTVSFVIGGGNGGAMWGTEELASSLYPGEGFRCTVSGGWDKDGVRVLDDRCIGYGANLHGWQFRSHVVNDGTGDVLTGFVFNGGE